MKDDLKNGLNTMADYFWRGFGSAVGVFAAVGIILFLIKHT